VNPGSIVAIFGTNLASKTTAASGYPLPAELGGTTVTVDGLSAPLYFVSPGQINAQLPSLPEFRTQPFETVVVKSPAGMSAEFQAPAFYQVPGIFTADSSGCGQAAALNVTPDDTVSVNSPQNSAQPGDYIAVFGTGFGPSTPSVPDGSAAPAAKLVSGVGDNLGIAGSAPITYQGLAPALAGVDQINFLIPPDAQQGCTVPLSLYGDVYQSPTVTLSIHAGRGRCVDPPSTSYGEVTLVGTSGTSDTFTAVFPSGPAVQPPALNVQNIGGESLRASSSRSCTVAGYTNLSAGAITIRTSGSPATTVEPQAVAQGAAYQSTLPAGFVHAGSYTVSSAPNQPAAFSATFPVGSPIQLQTTFPSGTTLSASTGLRIQWTGGDPDALVRIRLISNNGIRSVTNTYWTTAGAQSIAISGTCTNGDPLDRFCVWQGLPNSSSAQLVIDVLPPGGIAAQSGTTRFSWNYRYTFDSLILGN